ncbi:hypothetical protein [Pseudomonas sp. NPDC089401]|uniref:hypothetical protein n=1 Tax=Pseudomonas sp. NPDC089401 TaxID=3364462 RepID=UPI003826EA4F
MSKINRSLEAVWMEQLALMDVLKIAAGSGVVAALVSSIITWIKEGRQRSAQRRLEAEIDAIHLITRLDALAVACANNYWEFHDRWSQLRGAEHAHDIGCAKPELQIEPEKLAKIDRVLACRIAWLENDVSLGADGIRARWEAYLDTDEALDADADLVGHFGYEALLISRSLRDKYKLKFQGMQWGMPTIEKQLTECSERSKEFFKEKG